jgi:hypothetical protein
MIWWILLGSRAPGAGADGGLLHAVLRGISAHSAGSWFVLVMIPFGGDLL